MCAAWIGGISNGKMAIKKDGYPNSHDWAKIDVITGMGEEWIRIKGTRSSSNLS